MLLIKALPESQGEHHEVTCQEQPHRVTQSVQYHASVADGMRLLQLKDISCKRTNLDIPRVLTTAADVLLRIQAKLPRCR